MNEQIMAESIGMVFGELHRLIRLLSESLDSYIDSEVDDVTAETIFKDLTSARINAVNSKLAMIRVRSALRLGD